MNFPIKNIAVSPVIYKDKFLLIKRVKWPYKNLWSLPGGKVEPGEHPDETIIREIYEETSLMVKFIKMRGVVSEFLKNKNRLEGHFVIWVCETKLKSGLAAHQNEGEVKWLTKEEIIRTKKNIIPSDFEMINTFFFKSRKNLIIHKSHMKKQGKTYILEYFDSQ